MSVQRCRAASTLSAWNHAHDGPQCQQREQEYQRTRLDLEVAQADAAEQRDELLVLKLLQVDMEDRLVDALSRNGNLADECVRYKKKCSGAEAALQSSQAIVQSMQNKMAEYVRANTFHLSGGPADVAGPRVVGTVPVHVIAPLTRCDLVAGLLVRIIRSRLASRITPFLSYPRNCSACSIRFHLPPTLVMLVLPSCL